jgi:hypothetical protein
VEKYTNEASDGGGLFRSVPDPGWKKNPDPVSGINIPDYFSESLETVL